MLIILVALALNFLNRAIHRVDLNQSQESSHRSVAVPVEKLLSPPGEILGSSEVIRAQTTILEVSFERSRASSQRVSSSLSRELALAPPSVIDCSQSAPPHSTLECCPTSPFIQPVPVDVAWCRCLIREYFTGAPRAENTLQLLASCLQPGHRRDFSDICPTWPVNFRRWRIFTFTPGSSSASFRRCNLSG